MSHTTALLKKRRFRQFVVWGMLSLAMAPVLYALVMSIPHVYARNGVAVFLVIAIPVGLFVPRRRGLIIGVAASVIAAAVMTLHFVALNQFVIENKTGQTIKHLEFQWDGMILPLQIVGLGPGRKLTLNYHDLSYPQSVSVRAVLEDGTTIPADPMEFNLVFFFNPRIPISNDQSRRVHVVIGPKGEIQVNAD